MDVNWTWGKTSLYLGENHPASAAQTDRVGAGADPIGRLEEELIQLGDASGQVGEALQVGEQ